MQSELLASLFAHYEWRLSLLTFAAIYALSFVGAKLLALIPTFKEAGRLNEDAFQAKMAIPHYKANQALNIAWGALFVAVIFALILPFCLTMTPQPLWKVLLDIFLILMAYDFFIILCIASSSTMEAFSKGPYYGCMRFIISSTIPAAGIPAIFIRSKWRLVLDFMPAQSFSFRA